MIIGNEVIGTGPLKVIVLHSWLGDRNIWSPRIHFSIGRSYLMPLSIIAVTVPHVDMMASIR